MVNPNKGEVELKIDPDREVLRGIDKQRPVVLKFDANSLCEAEIEIRPRTLFDVLNDAFVLNVPIGLNEARVLLAHGLHISKDAAGRLLSLKTTDYTEEVLPKLGVALLYATKGNIIKVEEREPDELVVEDTEEDAATGDKKTKK